MTSSIAVTAAKRDTRPVLVCFSHLRWSFVYQRPQHLMSRAARRWRVYFLEEPVFDDALRNPELYLSEDESGVCVATPRLPSRYSGVESIAAQKRFLDELLERHTGAPLLFWYYTPMAVRFSLHREPDLCVYDCMDELSAFKDASASIAMSEGTLFSLADIVFTGGRSLYEAKKAFHSRVYAFPSSVDREHFAAARERLHEPPDQAAIPHPRLGFFGVVDERLDVDLVAALADLRPDYQLVMVGPVVKIDPATLPRRANIHWLGGKSYKELPHYLSSWDAGIMPFALNAATRFISPTKTPEYLAAGLPVVSTAIRDVGRDWGEPGLVSIASDAAAFVGKIEKAWSEPRADWLARVDDKLATLSWDETWRRMVEILDQELAWGETWRNISPYLRDDQPEPKSPSSKFSTDAEIDNV